MTNRIRVLLVDDFELARRGLRRMLELDDEIEVVGEAGDADEALGRVEELFPDVVIMDIKMGHINGLEATRLLRERGFTGAILVLSMFDEYLDEAITVGADGYMVKDAKREELVGSIRDTARGRFIFGASTLKSPERMSAAFGRLQRQWDGERSSDHETVLEPEDWNDHRVAIAAEEKALVRQTADKAAEGRLELSQGAEGPVTSLAVAAPDTVVTDVELIISPPVEPGMVLKLHQWLMEAADIDLGKITGSQTGDTILSVSMRRPGPLMRMLSELPNVREVTEEPYVDGGSAVQWVLKSSGALPGIGGGRLAPKRFRLALTD